MPWGTIIGGLIGGGANLYGAYQQSRAAQDAVAQQQQAFDQYAQSLNMTQEEIESYSQQYTQTLDHLDRDFDPYDMDQAFASLYEGVIQPMERDFSENVLPQIQASYSGVAGAGAGMSGAAAEAENRARRDQAEAKAQLRAGERDKAIERNYQEFDRRQGLQATRYQAQLNPLQSRMQTAQSLYAGTTDTINAQLAARQAQSNIFSSGVSGMTSGIQAGLGVDRYLSGLDELED